jgi:hypothetical protein
MQLHLSLLANEKVFQDSSKKVYAILLSSYLLWTHIVVIILQLQLV